MAPRGWARQRTASDHVAAHAWDVLGAQRAAWVAHREQRLLATVPEPPLRAASLQEAAVLLDEL
jgi:hypothetical protein